MRTDLPDSAPSSPTILSVVGVCSWSELEGGDYLDCLSEREKRLMARLRPGRRYQSWLAGRMVAKYCFLESIGSAGPHWSDAGRPQITRVSAKELNKFSAWMYRQVEIVTEDSRPGEPPRLAWSGRPSRVCVSLSHADGQSCAYLDLSGPIGLDLEETEPRRDSFYRQNFSHLEQAWVDRLHRDTGAGPAWLFTLLWTLKEAALKADDSGEGSLWQMRGLEVLLPTEVGDWALGARLTSLRPELSPVQARVRRNETEHLFQVGISGSAQHILSVIKGT